VEITGEKVSTYVVRSHEELPYASGFKTAILQHKICRSIVHASWYFSPTQVKVVRLPAWNRKYSEAFLGFESNKLSVARYHELFVAVKGYILQRHIGFEEKRHIAWINNREGNYAPSSLSHVDCSVLFPNPGAIRERNLGSSCRWVYPSPQFVKYHDCCHRQRLWCPQQPVQGGWATLPFPVALFEIHRRMNGLGPESLAAMMPR